MKKKVVIIGGGVAGMSAGIYACKNGFDVKIIEMHDKPGGQLTAWERKGYRFDYCLHWLVGTNHGVYNDIWKELAVIDYKTEIINHFHYVRMVDEAEGVFDIYNDLDEWELYLKEFAPGDAVAIAKLCNMMRKSDNLDQFEDAPGMRSLFDYFQSFVRMGSFIPVVMRYGKKTIKELFEDLGFKDRKLLYFLNKLFEGRDFSALGFIMMLGWAHARNAGYIQGGSFDMAMRISSYFKQLGGTFVYERRVSEILVEEDLAVGVRMKGGAVEFADYVIAACDGHSVLFDMLDAKYRDPQFDKAYSNWELFTPLVMIGFGISERILSDVHNTSYLPKEKIMIGSTEVGAYSIMNRSMYDPVFAPDGKTTLLMQFESPWDLWEELEGPEYIEEKRRIHHKAIDLLEQHYPGIRDKIEVMDIATPQTTVRYTGVWRGAYEGFMPSADVMNGLPMELKHLDHFYMAGQWLFPGGGLPPAAQSGKWVIQKMCKKEGRELNV